MSVPGPSDKEQRGASEDALLAFERDVEAVEREARERYELPEPGLQLDLDERAGDGKRTARHIHQVCSMHSEHFRRANFVKLAYLGRFFVTEARPGNALGVTAAARSLLELDAFLRYVHAQLAAEAIGAGTEWQSRGRRYCDAIVRARYATSDEEKRAVLTRNGVPERLTRPPTVKECITVLRQRMAWAEEHYKLLCDWVHANLTSQTISTVSGRSASMSSNEAGGMLFLPQETMINVHRYDPQATIGRALEGVLPHAHANYSDAVEALRSMQQTPLTREELIRLTGNEFGVEVVLPPPARGRRSN